jgi:hypothetical protein
MINRMNFKGKSKKEPSDSKNFTSDSLKVNSDDPTDL